MKPAAINSRLARVITSVLFHPRFERYAAEANSLPLLSRTNWRAISNSKDRAGWLRAA